LSFSKASSCSKVQYHSFSLCVSFCIGSIHIRRKTYVHSDH
jgi:hypothetical protein